MLNLPKQGDGFKVPQKLAGVLFARPPVLGQAKTRLAYTLGEPATLAIYQTMLVQQACLFNYLQQLDIKSKSYVYIALPTHMSFGQARKLLTTLLPKKLHYRKQTTGTLGDRMVACLSHLLKKYQQVLLWGADIPTLQKTHLEQAIAAYPKNCLVPTHDGGYALISVSRENFHPDMMKHIAWGTSLVLQQQLANFNKLGCEYCLTETIIDVDELSDLLRSLLYLKKKDYQEGKTFARQLATALEKLLIA